MHNMKNKSAEYFITKLFFYRGIDKILLLFISKLNFFIIDIVPWFKYFSKGLEKRKTSLTGILFFIVSKKKTIIIIESLRARLLSDSSFQSIKRVATWVQ